MVSVIHHNLLHLAPGIAHIGEGVAGDGHALVSGEEAAVSGADDVGGVALMERQGYVCHSDGLRHKAVGIIAQDSHLVAD